MISILSLIFVVALAGVSPVYAQDIISSLDLNPEAACQGATVQMAATYPGFETNPCTGEGCGVLFGGLDAGLDVGLECTEPTYDAGVVTVTCSIVVPSDATCGEYTLELAIAKFEIVASASAPFEVLCPCPAPAVGPVGGVVIPTSTLAIVAPWLAVLSLLCIGTIGVVVKKRRA